MYSNQKMEEFKNIENSDSDDEPEFAQFKVVILGDGTVGKTSLCSRLCDSSFEPKYKQTIGLDFFVKRFELPG
jgi:Ras-related protein Rab-28